jgi:hypothetical protein
MGREELLLTGLAHTPLWLSVADQTVTTYPVSSQRLQGKASPALPGTHRSF